MSEWISVKDRLPEHNQMVLVYRPTAHLHPSCDPEIKICEFIEWKKIGYQFESSIHEATYWQPLPEPPKPTNFIDSFIADGGFDRVMGCKNGE